MKIPYAEPGTSRKNKTGGSARFPLISDRCISCGQCIEHCPDGCIAFNEKRKAVPDYGYCKGCGICAEICPVKAIEMKERERK
jgi:pyruvate ferredoxin oxidoreductase delta subunit